MDVFHDFEKIVYFFIVNVPLILVVLEVIFYAGKTYYRLFRWVFPGSRDFFNSQIFAKKGNFGVKKSRGPLTKHRRLTNTKFQLSLSIYMHLLNREKKYEDRGM